jgi:antitoxin component YwqK of YwqJK toxin-antitoxin module
MSSYAQCKAITKAGTRCTRAAIKSGYCTQHYNIYVGNKQDIDTSLNKDVIENIISDYLEYDEVKELEKEFKDFKFNPNRIEVKEYFYDNMDIRLRDTFADEILIKTEKWNENRSKKEYNYKNGELEGKQYTYYPNGRKHKVENYINGIKEGKQYKYYQTGALYAEENYTNGELNGEQYEYYGNNKILSIQNYANGIPGELIKYNIKGEKIYGEIYKNKF